MAGFKMFALSYWLADRVTEVISSAGALVAPLAKMHAWTQPQYSPQFTLELDAGDVTVQLDGETGHGLTYYYDLAGGSGLLTLTGAAAGMGWRLVVEADGTNELTYVANYTFGTETAPDFSAMSNGDQVLLDFYAVSATRILVAASVVYAA